MTRKHGLNGGHSQEQGFSLVAVLVFVGIIASMSVAFASLRTFQSRNLGTAKVTSARDTIVDQVRRAVELRKSYHNAILAQVKGVETGNTDLLACFVDDLPGGADDCVAKLPSGVRVVHDLKLYSEGDWQKILSGAAGVLPVTGTRASPAYYNDSGKPCTVSLPDQNCPFQVFTSFVVDACDDADSPTCRQAYKATVSYTIRQNPSPVYRARSLNKVSFEDVSGTLPVIVVAKHWSDYGDIIMPLTTAQSASNAAEYAAYLASLPLIAAGGGGGGGSGGGGTIAGGGGGRGGGGGVTLCPVGTIPFGGACKRVGF